jgi:small subunit ribosomal protein S10
LRAYDHRVLDQSAKRHRRNGQAHRRPRRGPDPDPHPDRALHHEPFSPHADKKSMEQFEIRTHKRLLDIIEPTARRWTS